MLLDEQGHAATVGSHGLWLDPGDFQGASHGVPVERLSFPSDWPAAYSSVGLRQLIGKRGQLPAKRVAVAGEPVAEEMKAELFSQKILETLAFYPLQSFSNAQRAAKLAQLKLSVVRGWVIWELLDGNAGTGAFVAERYWWNSRDDGRWVDLTPRPLNTAQLLLVETEVPTSKEPQMLSVQQKELAERYLKARFPAMTPVKELKVEEIKEVKAVKAVKPQEIKVTKEVKEVKEVKAKVEPKTKSATLDYSKWSNIVDSDDEEDPRNLSARADEDVGVKDLAETGRTKKEPPIPDYLLGSTGGGGGTNCLTSIVKMLDAEQTQENVHQLAQVFGRSFHSALLDAPRQAFYRQALQRVAASGAGAFVVVLGLGSALPMLFAAKNFSGLLLETSEKLGELAQQLLKANGAAAFHVAKVKALDDRSSSNAGNMVAKLAKDESAMVEALKPHLPKSLGGPVVLLTERMAHDLLSNGIVPCCITAHQAVKKLLPSVEIFHIPQTVELQAAPGELRSDRLKEFDIRPFNALRHTSSNEKADFWWWPVRLDNQQNTSCSILGPAKTLCGFDFQRSPEIGLEEVRRPLKLQATQRGRCNCAAIWWTVKFQDLEYSTRPKLADGDGGKNSAQLVRSEWKQAIHYLAGETALFPGDVVELLVSITPRFTFRMMQQSPMSVEAPLWVKAPNNSKFSATLPILPYHFLMMTDLERLEVYQRALKAAIKQQSAKLGRRVRVLDAGCGIGLLGLSAALEGAEVWLCEAVPLMRHVCREVVAANSGLVAEQRGLVQLLPPMMSTRLHTEDVPKFDIVVSEVMDLWCLGEGIIPTMRHAHQKLLNDTGLMLPGKLRIYVQPLELSLWREAEEQQQVDLQPLQQRFRSKFSALRIQQFPHRYLTKEPILAMEIDLANLPSQPAEGEANIEGGVKLCIRMGKKPALNAKVTVSKIDHRGMLSGYGLWWSADLGNGHEVTSDPSNPQRSWKQLVRWLDAPRFVEEQEEIQVLTCYNDQQVNVEDIHLTREMIEQYQQQQAATLNVSNR